MTIILSTCQVTDLKKITGRFLGKFVVKRIIKIPSHLAYVATPLCETLTLAKQSINDKLQGSVATHLRCGGVVNNQIEKGLGLLLSLNRWIFDEDTDKSVVVSVTHFLHLLAVWWPGAWQQDNHLLVSISAKYSPILFFSLADSAINLS